MENKNWKWWAGRDEERYTEGPFECREDAVSEGRSAFGDDVGFYVLEAVQESPIDLSRYIDVDDLLERMVESVDENCSDPDGDSVTDGEWNREQEKDLEAMLKETVRAWQAKHNIKINSWLFLNSRNQEWIEPIPEPEESEAVAS